MKRRWITDIEAMGFTDEEREVIEKVTDYTDTILYFNGKDYKTEDPNDTYYFTSKDLLMENMNYNYTELEKEGVFDEENEAPAEEPKVEEVCITYQTTASGCKAFIKDMWSDIGEALDKGGEGLPIPILTLGSRQIKLIDCPLTYEGIQALIEDMVEEYIY